MTPEEQAALGIVAAGALAWGAYRSEALTASGAWAAFGVGSVIFGCGGWAWAGLLLLFFLPSAGLSYLFAGRKRALQEKFAKGSRRDWAQVLANGGLAAGLAIWHAAQPTASWVWPAFAGALAAAAADTWGTEIGVLSPNPPHHILTGRAVPPGTSGGISPLGMAAALAGAGLLGVGARCLSPTRPVWLAVTAGGLGGALLDSVLGATVQAVYFCPRCAKETEHTPRHTCGTPTRHLRGWRWMNNDAVNALASLAGALLAAWLA